MNAINPKDSKDTLSKTPFKNFAVGVIVMLIFLIGHSLFAQVGVGNTNPQAQLDISASNTTSPTNQDGILIPRVTNLPADASMTANQDGILVFYDNTGEDGKGFYYWDDTAGDWIKINAGIDQDNQTIDNFSLVGTTLRLSLANDGQPLQTVNLASLQDGTGTDDQTIDNFSLSGTTLRISLENDGQPLQTVNLASLQDGTGTDDQNLTAASLTGTTLNLGIENGTGTSVNLAALQDGTGSDDQTIDNFSLVGTTLRLSLENDGQPLQTVNLASLQDGTGTDDQNIQNLAFNSSTNILTVGIENGTAQTVDLSALNSGGDITQIIAGTGMTGGGTTGAITVNAVGTNGLLTYANDIRLGGALTQNTTITNNAFDMIFNVNGSGTFKVQDGGVDKFEMNTFGDAVFGGDLYLRDENSNATSTILARFIDSDDDGVLEIFQGGSISNRIHGNGTSFFNAGKVAIGQTTADGFLEILAANNGTEPHIKLVHNGASGARINFTNTATTSNVWTLFGNTDDIATNSVFNFFHSGTGNIMQITGDGKVAVGAAITEGTFNVTGDTYHSDDIYLRDGAVNGGDILARLYDSADDGVLDIYSDNAVNHRIHGNGETVFNELGFNNTDVRIESDTRANMFLVDASDNLVRIGNGAGGLAQQGSVRTVTSTTGTLNVTVDYIANLQSGTGSTVGLGTAEFVTDGGNQVLMMDANLIPFNDDDDGLGFSNFRWTALWATDGTINTSDLTLKKDIEPLKYGLDQLMDIETITYKWKNGKTDDTKIGFSAQNLQKIIPEVVRDYDLVKPDEKGSKPVKVKSEVLGVYYSDIIPVTVKAIQELNKKIETLETENTILKDKLSRLEALEARLLAVEKNMNNVNTNTSVSHRADE
ncbi:MAG: tail fiber domain-containing protein [Winogradskyella sp.]|nr:tail fiber domain-containing protein [Winogradskyella sp.]